MKIAVVCANGKAGQLIVKEAVNRGFDVTAVVKGENKSAAQNVIVKDLFDLTAADLAGFDAVVDAFGAAVPVYEAGLAVYLGSGLEFLRALDETLLDAEFRVVVYEGADSLEHQVRTLFHKGVVDVSGCVGRTYLVFLAEDDLARVYVLVQHKRGHAGEFLSVDDGPVDRSCASVLRQQGGVQVERTQLRH